MKKLWRICPDCGRRQKAMFCADELAKTAVLWLHIIYADGLYCDFLKMGLSLMAQ